MDDIHEYLLLKGVDAVSIHGGKEQDERNEAITLFKVRETKHLVLSVQFIAVRVGVRDFRYDMSTEVFRV